MFATIYLPNFYLQAAMRHHPKLRAQPVALIDTAESKVSIIQLNELAEKVGVTEGMTPSQALARCLQVVIRTRERAQENVIGEIHAQAGIAPSPDTSFLAAHLARPVLQIEEPKEFLAPLPIETLAMV